MKRSFSSLAGLLILPLLFLLGCTEVLTREKLARENIPAIKKDCGQCHVSPDVTRKTAALKKQVSELCFECHQDRTFPAEHKLGVSPGVTVKELPLQDGKITCTTCHDPHRNSYGSMLRVPQSELCLLCHRL
jgi:predicted CXXCH cytochrome family protein